MTVSWNMGLITLIRTNSNLHTPMYFFLSYLSLLDICYVSTTVPKMLSDFFKKHKFISFMGCTMQYFFFSGLALTECCLLTAMAYDRYAAICNPLLYTAIMSPTLCVQMVVGKQPSRLAGSLSQLCVILQLHFCGPNVIYHFFGDIFQLVVLSCTDTFFVQLMMAILTLIFGIVNVLVIMTSYVYFVFFIMNITLAKDRSKAFTTCAFYTSGMFVYLRSSSGVSSRFNRFALVFYGVVIPTLSPLVYI
ncbi:olfactory receptor 5AN1-like [Myotis myotis]|uniref:olfactory receptor 5AN1-like n=1 Tax=Myotis myotis TaxID=51298 RepID=UPI00174BB226|nr:olfactory receptor 5AN1-like [Myotis myotis]